MILTTRSDVEPLDPSLAVPIVLETFMVQYLQFVTVALLVYDSATTFDQEVKYFWKLPMNSVNSAFFANRYIGILGAVAYLFFNTFHSNLMLCLCAGYVRLHDAKVSVGQFAYWSRTLANWFIVILIDYILMIRVLALFSQNKRLGIILKALLVSEAIILLALKIYINVAEDIAVGGISAEITVCGSNNAGPQAETIIDWVLPMAFGTTLLSLVLYKSIDYWKMYGRLNGAGLVEVIIQDQVIYFFLVVICCVLNIIQVKLEVPNEVVSIALGMCGSPSILCIIGSRMLIHLKEAGQRGVSDGTSYRLTSMTAIEFSK